MRYIRHASPNFNTRKDGAKPEFIVLHFTEIDTQAALARLCDPAAAVSAHYLVDEDGNIHHLVDEEKRAWHAGVSSWQGREDMNSLSIGIEISNDGKSPYTARQMYAVSALCRDIMQHRKIPRENVLGHSDVAPARKQDPGAHFPWEKLAKEGIGFWPKPRLSDKFNAAAVAGNPERLQALFRKAGYTAKDATVTDLVMAFHRRYAPECFGNGAEPGRPTARTVALLRALARKQKKIRGRKPC